MRVLTLRAQRMITSQRTFAGNLIRLFDRRSDGWYEHATHGLHLDDPEWVRVSADLAPRLDRLERDAPPAARAAFV